MEKNKRMTTIIVAAILLLTIVGVAFAYYNVVIANGTRQNLSATTVESVNLTLDDNDATSYSGQLNYGNTITKNLKLTNEGGPTKVALYFQDLINTYTAGAFTYTLSYATTENGSYTAVATDVAIPRRSKASSTAKITEIEMPATTTRYYRVVITYNHLETVDQTRDLTATFKTGFTIKAVPKTIAEAHPDGDYLKDYCGTLDANGDCTYTIGTRTAYNTQAYVLGNENMSKSKIYYIDFVNTTTPAADTVYATNGTPWDVSEAQNGSVKAWVTKGIKNNYYSSLANCNANSSNFICEEIEAVTVYYDTESPQTYYELEDTCWNEANGECLPTTSTIRGKQYMDTKLLHLYIGQEGGVIANPNSAHLFERFSNLTQVNLQYLNTSYVTNMSHMFRNEEKLDNLDLSMLDTSNVTDMSYMFSGYKGTQLNIGNLEISNVTNMKYMFCYCTGLQSLDLSEFDTANVVDMGSLFYQMTSLESINLSNFDTSNVTDMSHMFENLGELLTLDVSSFNTSNVTNMYNMFSSDNLYGSKLQTLNLGNFDTSNVTNMASMFAGLNSLTTLDLSNFDTAKVTDMHEMFNDCARLTTLDISNFDTSNVTSMRMMFTGLYYITTLRMNNATFNSVTGYSNMFSNFGTSAASTQIYVNQNGKNFIDTNFPDLSSKVVLV